MFVDTPGFQTKHGNALKQIAQQGCCRPWQVDVVLLVVEAGRFGAGDARVLELLPPDVPVLLVASKLDTVAQRQTLAPWLLEMQQRHPFAELLPVSAKNKRDMERLLEVVARYLPHQPWWYEAG